MHPRFHRPEIVTGGEDQGIDAVHDPFIVGDRASFFGIGYSDGSHKLFSEHMTFHVLVGQIIHSTAHLGTYQTFRDIVG